MITRRDSLTNALRDVQQGALDGASAVVVNEDEWNGFSASAQRQHLDHAAKLGLAIRTDRRLGTHFVEVLHGPSDRPLSSESPA
jgi:hypothetical protein